MKRIIFILLAFMSTAVCSAGTEAMSNSKVRKETRFLTDKMAYELNLSTKQYNDVYEINYDFITEIRYLMDDVLYGEDWAINRYYEYLDLRNDDLRWVLNRDQYARFMRADYFYRPIYASNNHWYFRVYVTYPNHGLFYFPRPYHYRTYRGGHYRTHYDNMSYYRGRYNHQFYNETHHIRDNKFYITHRRSDFGTVVIRHDSPRRPSRDDVYTNRRSISNENRREATGESRRSYVKRSTEEQHNVERSSRSTDRSSVNSIKRESKPSEVRTVRSSRRDNDSSSSENSSSRPRRSSRDR